MRRSRQSPTNLSPDGRFRGTRPVIRVKEKEVSASSREEARIAERVVEGRRLGNKGRSGKNGGYMGLDARKALTKGNGDIYRGRAGYKGGLVHGNGFGFT